MLAATRKIQKFQILCNKHAITDSCMESITCSINQKEGYRQLGTSPSCLQKGFSEQNTWHGGTAYHSEKFTTNLRVMKCEIHMLLKESTYETQTEYTSIGCLNDTLPISKTCKAKRNFAVKGVLCPYVPSVNIG